MDSVYNNTFVPLNAGQIWEGKSESISKFTVASVSCITDVSGILNLYFSLNNNDFDFIKTYELKPDEPFIINQKVEGKYFKAQVTNNSGVNQTYLRLTTTYKEDIRSDLDIRPLHSEKDTVSIPALNDCIVDGKLNVNVEGVTVSGVVVDISGQMVDISGQMVRSRLYDSNGYAFSSQLVGGNRALTTYDVAGIRAKEGADIKEVNAVTDLAHGGTNLCVYDDVLNDKINNVNIDGEDLGAIKVFVSNTPAQKLNCDISGQKVLVDISGQKVITDISGQRVLVDISGQKVDISGQTMIVDISGQKVITDISGQKVDISGQRVIVDISGQRVLVDISGQKVITDISGQKVDISGQKVIVDISGQKVLVDISGQKVDISGQCVLVDISGQKVDISGQTVVVSGGIDISGQKVDISGQTVLVSNLTDISGFKMDISGQHVLVDISGQKVDISGQSIIIKGGVDISGQKVDISGQTMRVSNLLDISGFKMDISGQRVLVDISGQKVDISGQKVDISGQSIIVTQMPAISVTADISGQTVVANVRGYDGTTYNNLFVDADGFITANTLTAVHDNILLGFDTNYPDYCAGSTNVGIWSKDNPFALSQDGWYCSTDANTNDVSIYTYLNHYFGGYNQSDFTYNDIDTWYSIIQNWNCISLSTMPIVRVYSSTSRWDFTITAGTKINNGEQVMLYFGLLSRVKANDVECRRLHYSVTGGTGTRAGTEVITMIELWIPQTINEYINMNVIEGAVYVKNRGLINYYYTNDKVGGEQNDIRTIKTNSNKFNFLSNKLLVDVSGQRADISGQKVDISGQNVAVNTMWLNTETQHMDNPASLGNPNVIKSADGAMSTYLNASTSYYNVFTNKLVAGNMAPISSYVTNYDSTNESYYRSLAVKDNETYELFTNGGAKIAGVDGNNVTRTLKLDTSGRVDISGQSVLANAFSRTDTAIRALTAVQPTGTSTSNIRALETYAYNVCLNNSSNLNLPVTSTSTDTTQSMDVFVNNGSTTNNYTKSGLNMYQIYPKRKTYSMKGTTFNNTYNVILGGYYSARDFLNFDASTKVWYYRFTYGSTITSELYGDYIDASGNLQEDKLLANMTSSTSTTAFNALLGGVAIKNINSWRMSPNPLVNGTMDICNANNQASSLGGFYYNAGAVSSVNLSLCGMFCVPNGYIAWIPQLGATNAGNFCLGVIYANGSRRLIGNYYISGASKEVVSGGGNYHGIGGIFTAGDRIFLVGGDAGTGQRWGYFDIVMEQI